MSFTKFATSTHYCWVWTKCPKHWVPKTGPSVIWMLVFAQKKGINFKPVVLHLALGLLPSLQGLGFMLGGRKRALWKSYETHFLNLGQVINYFTIITPESPRWLDEADKTRRVYHSSETEEHLGCNWRLMFFAAIPLDGISSWLAGHRPSLTPCRECNHQSCL